MNRKITPWPAVSVSVSIDNLTPSIGEWLRQQAIAHGLPWLLAHADDGVIWGRLDGERLATSGDAVAGHEEARGCCPQLRAETLQQARLFGAHAELLLWRDGDGVWHARLIRDTQPDEAPVWTEFLEERHMLWGDIPTPLGDSGFTLWTEGAQGLRHAVPRAPSVGADNKPCPPRLRVRHYLASDSFARIEASRLVGFAEETEA